MRSLFYEVTLLWGNAATRWRCHVTLPWGRAATRSRCHEVTLPRGHVAMRSRYREVTLSRGHALARSRCHEATMPKYSYHINFGILQPKKCLYKFSQTSDVNIAMASSLDLSRTSMLAYSNKYCIMFARWYINVYLKKKWSQNNYRIIIHTLTNRFILSSENCVVHLCIYVERFIVCVRINMRGRISKCMWTWHRLWSNNKYLHSESNELFMQVMCIFFLSINTHIFLQDLWAFFS